MKISSTFWSALGLFALGSDAITLTTTTSAYTVDAGSTDTFSVTVSRSNCDVTSIKFLGQEAQSQSQYTQIASGLGTATVTASQITYSGNQYVKITCVTSTLTQYYVIRDTEATLHIATYTSAEPTIGELRWIARLNLALFPNDDWNQASSIAGSSSTVEGKDVFVVNGQTRSKFYSSQRFIDDNVHCVSGSTMKACVVIPGVAYEGSSGGPFFRDIDTNPTESYTGLYWYMNSNHIQTEAAFRMGLHGPYACVFSRSDRPAANMDTSFWAGLGATGYVAASGRGTVTGKATGVAGATYQIVLHWYNAAAQYWVYADSSGSFTSPLMKPGTYTQVLYQGELKVATATGVDVTAGGTTTKNIASTWTVPATTLFQIGDWDGQPAGFRNAAKQLRMHPSDSRMSSWGPLTYTVGSSTLDGFPMALFKGVNSPVTIKFTLTAAQASGAATLRIGTTLSFNGGRPSAVINGRATGDPGAPVKINSRGVTRGGYRGYGDIYNFAIASGGLVSGSNTITIGSTAGASSNGFLSPNFIFDAVHLFR